MVGRQRWYLEWLWMDLKELKQSASNFKMPLSSITAWWQFGRGHYFAASVREIMNIQYFDTEQQPPTVSVATFQIPHPVISFWYFYKLCCSKLTASTTIIFSRSSDYITNSINTTISDELTNVVTISPTTSLFHWGEETWQYSGNGKSRRDQFVGGITWWRLPGVAYGKRRWCFQMIYLLLQEDRNGS